LGIGGIVFGSTGRKGLTVLGYRLGIDWIEHEKLWTAALNLLCSKLSYDHCVLELGG
jgi:hypothetical protein